MLTVDESQENFSSPSTVSSNQGSPKSILPSKASIPDNINIDLIFVKSLLKILSENKKLPDYYTRIKSNKDFHFTIFIQPAIPLLDYLRKNIKYPPICRENGIQGRVLVSFVVNKDGAIVEPQVVKSVNKQLDQEALRVISTMPNWKPGKQRGKPVHVKYTVPVNFRLN